MATAEAEILLSHRDRDEEIAALARLVTYARRTAEELGAESARHCLNMALKALLEELARPEGIKAASGEERVVFN
jgi:hypothetical protein